jgi:hypothetical protein
MVNSEGFLTTEISLGFCREAVSNEESLNFIPRWMNEKYRPENSDVTYNELFGAASPLSQPVGSVLGEAKSVAFNQGENIPKNNAEAAKILIEDYIKADREDRKNLVLDRTSRPIVNRADYFNLLGATREGDRYVHSRVGQSAGPLTTGDQLAAVDGNNPDGTPVFSVVNRDIVQKFVNLVRLQDAQQSLEDAQKIFFAAIGKEKVKVDLKTNPISTAKVDVLESLSDSTGPFSLQNQEVAEEIRNELETRVFLGARESIDQVDSITLGKSNLPPTVIRTPETPNEEAQGVTTSKIDITGSPNELKQATGTDPGVTTKEQAEGIIEIA